LLFWGPLRRSKRSLQSVCTAAATTRLLASYILTTAIDAGISIPCNNSLGRSTSAGTLQEALQPITGEQQWSAITLWNTSMSWLGLFYGDTSRAGLGWAGLGWAGLGWAGLGWAGLGWAGLGWAGLGWAGLGWAGLGWAGLGWAGLGWVGYVSE